MGSNQPNFNMSATGRLCTQRLSPTLGPASLSRYRNSRDIQNSTEAPRTFSSPQLRTRLRNQQGGYGVLWQRHHLADGLLLLRSRTPLEAFLFRKISPNAFSVVPSAISSGFYCRTICPSQAYAASRSLYGE